VPSVGVKAEGVELVNAVIAAERKMFVDDRFARLEADVDAIKGDVKILQIQLNESIVANAREFGTIRADMEKGFGALRTETEKGFGAARAEFKEDIGTLRTDTEKGFGAIRAEFKQDIGSLRAEVKGDIGALRADMEKGFGTLRADMEKNKGELSKEIESAKLWIIVAGAGALVSVAQFVGRVFKLF